MDKVLIIMKMEIDMKVYGKIVDIMDKVLFIMKIKNMKVNLRVNKMDKVLNIMEMEIKNMKVN